MTGATRRETRDKSKRWETRTRDESKNKRQQQQTTAREEKTKNTTINKYRPTGRSAEGGSGGNSGGSCRDKGSGMRMRGNSYII